ncbi:MAG TPA: hypothetical protein VFG21_00165 [Xanthomonadaceae bacterium]|nr:hypothetical protein [Xanthomonadaceae bacterium]
MDERELRSLYRGLQRKAPDADHMAALAAGARSDDAGLLALARTPGAAAAYRVARDSRGDAQVLAQSLRRQATAAGSRTRSRPVWHYALAASLALFAVVAALGPQWGQAPDPGHLAGDAPPDAAAQPLFAGSFEDGQPDPAQDEERAIFNAGFDS